MKTKDIRINKELIMKYGPCLDGLDNFNTYYTDISIKELINSKKINYDHKVWLLKHIVPKELLVLWAIDSSFAAYAYSATATTTTYAFYAAFAISNNVANAAYYASRAAYAADYASNAAYYAANAANYAIRTSRYAGISVKDAEKERLQALLYLIETEGA